MNTCEHIVSLSSGIRRASLIVLVSLACLGPMASFASAQDREQTIKDRERVVNLSEVRELLDNRAMRPLLQKMENSRLTELFETVQKLGSAEKPDLDELAAALDDLSAEVGTFLKDWDQVTGPMHRGRETLEKTIARLRLYLLEGPSNTRRKVIEGQLAVYQRRLKDLAKQVREEKDPDEKERKRNRFALLVKLRKELEKRLPGAGGEALLKKRLAIYGPMIKALTEVDRTLEVGTFSAQHLEQKLLTVKDSIDNHREMVSGLIEVRDLVVIVTSFMGGDGSGGPAADFTALLKDTEAFSQSLDEITGKLADQLAVHSDHLSETVGDSVDVSDVDVDAELMKYLEEDAEE